MNYCHRVFRIAFTTAGFAVLGGFAQPARCADELVVPSPNREIEFRLELDAGQLRHEIRLGGQPVIEPSSLGIIVDGVRLGEGVKLGASERYQLDESYPWYGSHSPTVDRCNGVKTAVTHLASGTEYTLEVRACNDGVALRYIAPGKGVRTPDEATVFRLPPQGRVWYHDLEDHYEGRYVEKSVRAVEPGAWVAPPLTVRLPDGVGYAAITEGALVNYSGMGLQGDGEGGFHARLGHAIPASWPFRLRFKDEVAAMSKPATIEGTITTPWRIVILGKDLNALVNSDIVHNVAPPPDPKLFPEGIKTHWIQPGRAVWNYLDGGSSTPDGAKEFSRLAGQLGFEYSVLEGYWARWSESELKNVVDYSRQHGVKIMLWKRSSELRNPQLRREFFEICKRSGAAGAKIDFFDHEHKVVIDRYEAILREAAEFKLVIDFHGANKPTGMERTWPNLLGQEGIRGFEMRPPYSQHDVTLPFTRMLAGLADYTPTHFGQRMADTTWAHQVANAITLPAPLLVFAAHPANIMANPTADMVKSIPSVWDETVVLSPSEIGQVAAFARRKGDTWFVAVTNGVYSRAIRIDLSFLGRGSHRSMLVRDGVRADSVRIENLTLRRNGSLFVDMPAGGGFVGRFTPDAP